jgi:hypothetical protein
MIGLTLNRLNLMTVKEEYYPKADSIQAGVIAKCPNCGYRNLVDPSLYEIWDSGDYDRKEYTDTVLPIFSTRERLGSPIDCEGCSKTFLVQFEDLPLTPKER